MRNSQSRHACVLPGTLPMAAWRNLSELTKLQLGGNNFTGSLPPELATIFPHLVKLNVSSSNFTGATLSFQAWHGSLCGCRGGSRL